MFRRRDQAHVPFWKGLAFQLWDSSKYRNMTIGFHRLPENGFMPGSSHPIQDYSSDVNILVELKTPQHHSGHRSGTFRAVNDQDYRCMEEFGQFSSAGTSLHIDPVVKTSVTFYDRKICR